MQTVILSNPGTDPWVATYKANGVSQTATVPEGSQLVVIAEEAPGLTGLEVVARPCVAVRSIGIGPSPETVVADAATSGAWVVCAVLIALRFWQIMTP